MNIILWNIKMLAGLSSVFTSLTTFSLGPKVNRRNLISLAVSRSIISIPPGKAEIRSLHLSESHKDEHPSV